MLGSGATGDGGAEASDGSSVNHQGRGTGDGAEGAADGSGAEGGLHDGQVWTGVNWVRVRVSLGEQL